MGRPRKLRPENVSVTASPEMGGVINTTFTSDNATDEIEIKSSKEELLPFLGKESLEPGKPRFFLNGKKLLRLRKVKINEDKLGNPLYVVKRDLARTIDKNKKDGKKFLEYLKQKKIPGA